MRIDRTTRIIHLFMAGAVLFQLLSSLWMMEPEPGKPMWPRMMLFSMHVWFFGWMAFMFGCVYAMMRQGNTEAWRRLIPWFSREHRRQLFAAARKEIPDLFRGRLAPVESNSPLAGAVHGLGFMLLLAQGATGAYAMITLGSYSVKSTAEIVVLTLHEWFGILMWIFVIAHILMMLYHLALGHRNIREIFDLSREPSFIPDQAEADG